MLHSVIRSSAVALNKGCDRAFLVGAGFTVVVTGAIQAAGLISSRDSHRRSKAARIGEADGGDAATVPGLAA